MGAGVSFPASKEKFRESVTALIEVDVSPDDSEFWDELWKIPSSAEEVFELIPPDAARRLRDERFDNLSTLFTQATAQLCQIVETPYNIYFDQALNCVRVLTRIIPFLLEKGDLGEADANVEHLCWATGSSPIPEQGKNKLTDDASLDSLKNAANSKAFGEDDDDNQEPLALLVVHAAMHMLFLPQFTCDFYDDVPTDEGPNSKGGREDIRKRLEEEAADDAARQEAGLGQDRIVFNGVSLLPRPNGIVWTGGCGVSPKELGADGGSRKYDKNRIEVLRLLLACCCDPLFSPADEYNPLASRWLAVAVAADAPNAVCLFYSLLNIVLSHDPIGMGMPYSAAFNSDTHLRLVELSVQMLIVLLDCGLPGSPESVLNDNGEPIVEFEEASKGGFNMFRTVLARIDTTRELTFCFNGFVRLLKNTFECQNTLLPGSVNRIKFHQELLVLLWKMLEENPMFMNHILTQCDVNEILVPVCYLMFQSRRDPAQIGLVHICTFVLLKLSGERSFGVNLNKPFNTRLPCDLPLFSGSHADLLSITLHKLVVNGAYKLVPLYSCFITIICNVSPYWRSMSLVAAVKLVNLFELFSSPKFLYSGENAHRHLALLLEVFNNIIQYQYTGNQHLVYAIVRRKDAFGRLGSLTLEKAIGQCNKVYGEDEDEPSSFHSEADPAMRTAPFDDRGNPLDDKASRAAVSGVSDPTGEHFVPTESWLSELKATLPLETVTRLLQHLVPVVDEMCNRKSGVVDEVEILEVLKDVTMVGLLPVPHAIVIRKYQPNQYTALWFTAFMWGVIFLRNQNLPIFDGQAIELFQVSVAEEDDAEN
uniref:Dymeclin n=1 Tax=Corethron hystrix TaxID=216773 RepID=A0A7S1C0L8_9STRA|mmetsp:Transcript_9439/g.20937  ORF Transcript_9439/g.20937 Transcript_9439/m.20937 type:complete len:820 (+) Transcript_9439:195-2654(+)|eukprot:CAMPEP_0113311774 /NCGR_PEP_ID=MMETSP0010_2-20120614/8864_1 /TAXON_ID=216773 ORGANISM="Corethron hystrix, Strain 308" /NCGR_SAMPLE_ID=MMETSP0010_2 /ASSEMBLY_ACC=CAM_ASM_000155 /LENGTH=819 /DNA_ID=CAMNT_0000167455 /DNA_START=133 /DNA_END=2592 /DNA_ORIENTATION=+ /assembly_acc=CAM_ASM_000155